MQTDLKSLIFSDCMLISFFIESDMSRIRLRFEAYIPNISLKQFIELECLEITGINTNINPEFYEDLKRDYRMDDNDQRANEIYNLSLNTLSNKINISLESDMLEFHVLCKHYTLRKIEGVA